MDPETKKILQDSLDVSKENNIMLKKLVRAQKFSTVYRVVYWAIIILSTLGAFYFIKPFLGNVFNAYGVSGINNFSDISKNLNSNQQQIQDFLNSMK